MDTSTPFTHPPDNYCAKCGAKQMVINDLNAKVEALEVQAHNRNECVTDLEAKVEALREAAQKCVDETVGVIGCDALEELAELLEGE